MSSRILPECSRVSPKPEAAGGPNPQPPGSLAMDVGLPAGLGETRLHCSRLPLVATRFAGEADEGSRAGDWHMVAEGECSRVSPKPEAAGGPNPQPPGSLSMDVGLPAGLGE